MTPSPPLRKIIKLKIGVRASLCRLVLTAWLFVPALASLQAQNNAPQKPEGTKRSEARAQSVVRGRVIYEDTRRPLRRVEVRIYDPANKGGGLGQLVAWTNGRGEFQIRNVPAGKYFVIVNAPGIIRAGFFDSEEAQKEMISITVDGASTVEAVVPVKRGGAVSGKVTYEDGDPVVNASIKVLRKKDNRWIPVFIGRNSDRELTDERGMYRVSGLAPGEYAIGAAEEKMGLELAAQDDPDGGQLLNRALLSTTYFDGATNLSGATSLQIVGGDEKTEINIALADRPVHSIYGVVTLKPDNRPLSRVRISLKRRDEEPLFPSSLEDRVINTDERGRFTFDEVQDGSYTMTVTPPRLYPQRYRETPPATQVNSDANRKFAAKRLELNIDGADLTNLVVEVSNGGRVSGVVTVDGGKPLPRNLHVFLELVSVERAEQLSAPIQPDGTFMLEGISPGDYYLRTALQADNKFYTKAVSLGRSDLTREPLMVKEDEDITNVRMLISADVARLSGRILAADGKSPERGVAVLFVSADPVEQQTISRRMYGFTNAEGSFSVSGAPGEYLLILFRPGENFYQLRGEALRLRAATAQRVTLQSGENSRLELSAPKP